MDAHKIIFFGTTESSVWMLKKILEIKSLAVSLVVTKKGRPAGRKLTVEQSAVAEFCKQRNIPCVEVEKVKEILEQLKQISPNLFFVVDFGKILPQEVLDIPKKGTINFHPSLLPNYRGPSPITVPILNSDVETGFSYMLLDAEMDHGPVLYQEKVKIELDDTAESLEKRLFEKGNKKLEFVLTKFLSGKLKPTEQDHTKAMFTKLIKKEDALIDFTKEPAEVIERKVRAYNPAPHAFFFYKGKRIQILEASLHETPASTAKRGGRDTRHETKEHSVFVKTPLGIVAQCSNKTFLLLEVIKPEGKPARPSKEFERYFSS